MAHTWQRPPVRLVAALVLLHCTACAQALAPLLLDQKRSEIQVAAVPTGDGAQYVSVISEEPVATIALRNRWRKEAGQACMGDYLVMSESASQRRTAGRPAGNIHEGFVRCVSPEGTLRDEDKPATDGGRTGGLSRAR